MWISWITVWVVEENELEGVRLVGIYCHQVVGGQTVGYDAEQMLNGSIVVVTRCVGSEGEGGRY